LGFPGSGDGKQASRPTVHSAPSTLKGITMKDGIHPNYREVLFLDTSCDFGFVTRSTVAAGEKMTWKDGKEYPVYKLDISSESHPFYTGKQKIMDTAGRVDKFNKRYARKPKAAA
jgi:large subunit ribosomal protein L31